MHSTVTTPPKMHSRALPLILALASSGAASDTKCADLPPGSPDGRYTLTLGGAEVVAFCYKMGGPAPLAYIEVDESVNHAEWIYGVKDGNLTQNKKVRTSFSKIRLNETALQIVTNDCECRV